MCNNRGFELRVWGAAARAIVSREAARLFGTGEARTAAAIGHIIENVCVGVSWSHGLRADRINSIIAEMRELENVQNSDPVPSQLGVVASIAMQLSDGYPNVAEATETMVRLALRARPKHPSVPPALPLRNVPVLSRKGKLYVAPANDPGNPYAAGYDGNVFDDIEQAKGAITELKALGGTWNVDWIVGQYEGGEVWS
jgi:hypothetical protein